MPPRELRIGQEDTAPPPSDANLQALSDIEETGTEVFFDAPPPRATPRIRAADDWERDGSEGSAPLISEAGGTSPFPRNHVIS